MLQFNDIVFNFEAFIREFSTSFLFFFFFRTVKIMDTEDFLDLEHPAIELQGFLSICSRNLDRTVDVSIKK
jgi:hypothetical protein